MKRITLRNALAAIVIASGVSCSGPTEPTQAVGISITTVVPNSGPASGGTPVTVNGRNFTPSVGVQFGSVAASVQFVNSNQVIATTPPHAPGAVDVTVVAGGSSTSLSGAFTYSN